MTTKVKYDPMPLVRHIQFQAQQSRVSVRHLCEVHGIGYRRYMRWQAGEAWLDQWAADELAVMFGLHPSELFDGWWDINVDDVEDE